MPVQMLKTNIKVKCVVDKEEFWPKYITRTELYPVIAMEWKTAFVKVKTPKEGEPFERELTDIFFYVLNDKQKLTRISSFNCMILVLDNEKEKNIEASKASV